MKKRDQQIPQNEIVAFQNKLLSWYKSFGRHHFPWRSKNLDTYQIVISEILLQRTKAETIQNFYNTFLSTFPNWESIARAEPSFIEEFLRPIGLYRQRAKRIKDLSNEMVRLKGQFPRKRSDLEKIPYLGQYIANAIELQVFNKPSALLDVNMARVLERYFGERKLSDIRYDPYLQNLAFRIVNHTLSKEINWAILDFASSVCKARKPLCEKCLLSTSCTFKNKVLN